ncbi:MAG TPA: Fe-S cluster assembly protein SufD [Candidatus Nanopelagicaceae bacterium]|nr:Fe-S cluster assembly protein SufD [Candidatus Nanopelagicaceae bacterium]
MSELATSAPALTRERVTAAQLPGGDPAFVASLRQAAAAAYREEPWPSSTRDEDWRRTPQVDKLDPANYSEPATSARATPEFLSEVVRGPLAELPTSAILVDDQTGNLEGGDTPVARTLAAGLSQDAETWKGVLGTVATPGLRTFVALNTARFTGGACVRAARGEQVAAAVRLVHGVDQGSAAFPRTLVLVEEGASLTLVEEWVSPDGEADLLVPVVEVVVERGAHLTHVIYQRCGDQTVVQSTVRVRLAQDARYDLSWALLGGAWQKTYFDVDMLGYGSESKAKGLCIGGHQQHYDVQTLQDHIAGGAVSDLLYRVAVADRARSIFAGLIRVEEGAQKTNAYVQNRNLLLSPTAKADSNPTLEILANDVRCTHGTTAGRVDDDQLFYCQSRGIPEQAARRLVVEGFFADVIDFFPEGPLREDARQGVLESLEEMVPSGLRTVGPGSG